MRCGKKGGGTEGRKWQKRRRAAGSGARFGGRLGEARRRMRAEGAGKRHRRADGGAKDGERGALCLPGGNNAIVSRETISCQADAKGASEGQGVSRKGERPARQGAERRRGMPARRAHSRGRGGERRRGMPARRAHPRGRGERSGGETRPTKRAPTRQEASAAGGSKAGR